MDTQNFILPVVYELAFNEQPYTCNEEGMQLWPFLLKLFQKHDWNFDIYKKISLITYTTSGFQALALVNLVQNKCIFSTFYHLYISGWFSKYIAVEWAPSFM